MDKDISILGDAHTMTDTWGHMMPKKDDYFVGTVTLYETAWGTSGLFDYDIPGLSCSPWFFDALVELSDRKEIMEHLENRTILKIDVQVTVKNNKFKIKHGRVVKCELV